MNPSNRFGPSRVDPIYPSHKSGLDQINPSIRIGANRSEFSRTTDPVRIDTNGSVHPKLSIFPAAELVQIQSNNPFIRRVSSRSEPIRVLPNSSSWQPTATEPSESIRIHPSRSEFVLFSERIRKLQMHFQLEGSCYTVQGRFFLSEIRHVSGSSSCHRSCR